ncbi:EI24-domain-containing protein [Marasmius fiardii PR-910]|nr:EI24-domain-containing protein [Marasmius fiardii PR-910]
MHPPHASHGQSARSLYPTFLSLHESILLQLNWAWCGLKDAFRWDVVFSVAGDPEIRANIYKSLLLNTLSLTSIYVFDWFLQPLVHGQQKWLRRNVGWVYQTLWLFPVIGLSFYLNSSWCSVIAKRTFILQHGNRATAEQPTTYAGMIKAIATSAYRVVMVFTSLAVSFAFKSIPYVGSVISFIFLCWVDSYYCFEFVWIARGLSLSSRVRYLEERWAYYLAFGFPTAGLCTFGSGLANGAIFALVFPLFVIMAMHARPLPVDPYSPLPRGQDQQDTIKHPSPFIPIRLPIFAVVLFLNNWIVKIFSVGGRSHIRTRSKRTLSEASESIEEGGINKIDSSQHHHSATPRVGTDRLRIGRRKLD